MKINSKGYIEPEIGDEFTAYEHRKKAKTVLADEDNTCNKCVFYDDEKCYFPCMNGDRDDNASIIYKEVKDE